MLRTRDRPQRRRRLHHHRPRQPATLLHPSLPPSRLPTPTSRSRRRRTSPTTRRPRPTTHPRTTRWGQIRPSPWGQVRLTSPGFRRSTGPAMGRTAVGSAAGTGRSTAPSVATSSGWRGPRPGRKARQWGGRQGTGTLLRGVLRPARQVAETSRDGCVSNLAFTAALRNLLPDPCGSWSIPGQRGRPPILAYENGPRSCVSAGQKAFPGVVVCQMS